MQGIENATEPQALQALRATGATYDELKSHASVRRQLWAQQAGRCAYCERSIRNPDDDGEHRTKIEHFHPQKGNRWGGACQAGSGAKQHTESPTKWSNMLLCCDGNEGAGYDRRCDTSKGNTDICEEFRNPKNWAHGAMLDVQKSGRVTPATGLPEGAERVVESILNLNSRELVDARRRLFAALKKAVVTKSRKHRGLNQAQRIEIIETLRRSATTQEYGVVYLSVAKTLTR